MCRIITPALIATLLGLGNGCGGGPDLAKVFEGGAGRWVDLTYSFSDQTVYWPTGKPFRLERVAYGTTDGGYFYASNDFSAAEHGGTHLDAPIHFAEGRHSAEQIPLERLIGPAVVIDLSDRTSADYEIGVADLQEWEEMHGPIPGGAILLLRTGWGRYWPDPSQYLGTSRVGPEAVPELHFPGLSPAAARWVTEEREVDAVGIDTPSIDYGQSTTFESHVILYAENTPGFENVANLELLPATGSFVVALPMKIEGGSGGPLRIVAYVPD